MRIRDWSSDVCSSDLIENQAQSLINQAKNLTSLPVSTLSTLQQQVQQTRQLLGSAQRIAYNVQDIQAAFAQRYNGANLTATESQMVSNANGRWQDSVGAFEDALRVQAGAEIGRAHVCTPVTNAHLVCRLL